jgi:hypothetical protein
MPNYVKAALITAVQTFVASTLVTLLGVLSAVQGWVGGGEPPDLTAPAKVVVSALVAAVAGVVTAIYRAAKPPETTYTPDIDPYA